MRRVRARIRSWRGGRRERDRTDAMLQSGVCDRHDCFVRSRTIGLYYNRAVLPFGGIEQRSELLQRNFLVAEVNGGHRASSDADDLLVHLRSEAESGERQRKRNARLQYEVR